MLKKAYRVKKAPEKTPLLRVLRKKKNRSAIFIASVGALFGYFVAPNNSVTGVVTWQMCFTPGESCLPLIIKSLKQARRTIDLQAYTLTSLPIAQSLIDAKKRGVKVRVLLDKSQLANPHGQLYRLKKMKMDIRIDYRPAIAHNKVIIVDNIQTLTGSYNWTNGAEKRNAENLLLIRNKSIAKRYMYNFHKRWMLSLPLNKYKKDSQKNYKLNENKYLRIIKKVF